MTEVGQLVTPTGVLVAIVGGSVLVDAPDVDLARGVRWRVIEPSPGCRYAVRDIHDRGTHRCVAMHTELTGWHLVDHKNGDGLDNRRGNLRPANKSLNAANSRKRSGSHNTLRGAIWRPGDRWEARIQGRVLGTFRSEEDAARAYDSAAREVFGEFARLNFPEES